MPIYEYQCEKCNTKFETLRRLSQSTEPANCPKCNNLSPRIMSACCSKIDTGSGVTRATAGTSSCSSCGSSSCGSCHN